MAMEKQSSILSAVIFIFDEIHLTIYFFLSLNLRRGFCAVNDNGDIIVTGVRSVENVPNG